MSNTQNSGISSRQSALSQEPRRPAAPPAIYQLKVTLRHLRPPVWRRLQVPNSLTLDQLHGVLQRAMGWENGHMHEFRLGETHFGMTHDPLGGPIEMEGAWDEEAYRLSELGLRAKSKLTYEYDFGDSWEHELVVEKVLPAQPDFGPVCLEGARACPPEDSGGAWGYAEQLEALANPKHPAHRDAVEWLGANFDPEAFDLEAINQALASLALGRRGRRRRRA